MVGDQKTFKTIRSIDNSRQWLPFVTSILVVSMIAILIWFFRGGSFKLYASVFFGLYYLTKQVWLSVLLIGIIQNLAFLPLRFIGLTLSSSLREFEEELDKQKESEQYILFTEKVRKGNVAVVFYIFNFVVNAIAFFSAGRIFLIDFYSKNLDPSLIYSFIPYPEYPLQGTSFFFPFIKITETFALDWSSILYIWFVVLLLLTIPRFLWRLVKWLLWRNLKVLEARKSYNRLMVTVGGFWGTLFIASLYFLRHIPASAQGVWFVADLTRPNRAMNFVTAFGTFVTVLHAGFASQRRSAQEAKDAGIPQDVIDKVFKSRMRQTFKNALILGAGAFFVTSQIPSAFELSVATFEVIYFLSPYTFDKFVQVGHKAAAAASAPQSPASTPADSA